ncbi:MAG: hypothetical protein WCZ23_02795 [Rhodospirillaceae bacterium]
MSGRSAFIVTLAAVALMALGWALWARYGTAVFLGGGVTFC